MYLYRNLSTSRLLEKGEEKTKKATEKDIERRHTVKKLISLT